MFACVDIPDFPATAQAALLDQAFAFSPRVEDVAPGVVLIDLAGLTQLKGSLPAIAADLARRTAELGFKARIAIASNPDAARCAARAFTGVTLVGPGEEAERLGPLPVSVLDPPPEILETLDRWGVHTLRDLTALPSGMLSERLGQPGVRLQKLARGAAWRPLVPTQIAPHFEESIELDYPVSLLEPLLFVLNQLLSRLCARLTLHGLAASELRLKMEFEAWAEEEKNRDSGFGVRDPGKKKKAGVRGSGSGVREGRIPQILNSELAKNSSTPSPESRIPNLESSRVSSPESRSLHLAVPLRDPQTLLKLLQLHLQAAPPSAPVRKVTLTAEPAKPRAAQGGLFLPRAPDPVKLEVVLARLVRLVGRENVGSPELVDSHRPDAFRVAGFRIQEGRGSGFGIRDSGRKIYLSAPNPGFEEFFLAEPRVPSPESRIFRPLRVFRPPLAATVRTRDGRPAYVQATGGICGEVVAATGPWRTSGEWWTQNGWNQDEWDVQISGPGKPGIGDSELRQVASGKWQVASGNWGLEARSSGLGTQGSARKNSSNSGFGVDKEILLPESRTPNPESRVPVLLVRIFQDRNTGDWFIRGIYD